MEFLNSPVPTYAFLVLAMLCVVGFVLMFGLLLSSRSELTREIEFLQSKVNRPVQSSVSYDSFYMLERQVYELHERDWRTRLKRWIDRL